MNMHSGTTDWLKMVTVIGFIVLVFWWLEGAIGKSGAVWVAGALVLVLVFAGGTLFAHVNQKMTLNAITRFNADDAQIDRVRMQSLKSFASGESAMQKAAAQLTVLDAKRINQIAQQQAKLLTDTAHEKWELQNRQQETADTWTWDDEGAGDNFARWE